eukprot:362806-Chlamydomonas_euryale.AAC.1
MDAAERRMSEVAGPQATSPNGRREREERERQGRSMRHVSVSVRRVAARVRPGKITGARGSSPWLTRTGEAGRRTGSTQSILSAKSYMRQRG